jgi:hypothetical protein
MPHGVFADHFSAIAMTRKYSGAFFGEPEEMPFPWRGNDGVPPLFHDLSARIVPNTAPSRLFDISRQNPESLFIIVFNV